MDANVYKARLNELRKAFAQVDRRIRLFGPDDVTLLDKNTYKDYLEETRKLLDEAQDVAFDLCYELDNTSATDCQRIEEINRLESKTEEEYMKNARDVKNKVQELIDSIHNSTISATNTDGQYVQNNPENEEAFKP